MSFIGGLRKISRAEANIDFVGKARTWFIISALLFILSIGGLFVRKLNLGLAFEGGSAFTVPVATGTHVTVDSIVAAMKKDGMTAPEVQLERSGTVQQIRVQSRSVNEATRLKVVDDLGTISGQNDRDQVSVQNVGPTWGNQISKKALRALIAFLILVSIYISFRFEPKMAIGAFAALVHDVVITIGIYAIVGFEVNPATVIAYLTILGYSLYDSVVVFDKVRENQVLLTGTSRISYGDMVNKSVNQTLMRSINTSLSSLLPVGALLFVGVYLFGAETLKDLALSLFIGISVGSYSSIFIGPPLLAILKEREPRYKQMKARARSFTAAGAGAGGGSISVGSSSSVASSGSESASSPGGSSAAQRAAIQAKARKKRGGKRRR